MTRWRIDLPDGRVWYTYASLARTALARVHAARCDGAEGPVFARECGHWHREPGDRGRQHDVRPAWDLEP